MYRYTIPLQSIRKLYMKSLVRALVHRLLALVVIFAISLQSMAGVLRLVHGSPSKHHHVRHHHSRHHHHLKKNFLKKAYTYSSVVTRVKRTKLWLYSSYISPKMDTYFVLALNPILENKQFLNKNNQAFSIGLWLQNKAILI